MNNYLHILDIMYLNHTKFSNPKKITHHSAEFMSDIFLYNINLQSKYGIQIILTIKNIVANKYLFILYNSEFLQFKIFKT